MFLCADSVPHLSSKRSGWAFQKNSGKYSTEFLHSSVVRMVLARTTALFAISPAPEGKNYRLSARSTGFDKHLLKNLTTSPVPTAAMSVPSRVPSMEPRNKIRDRTMESAT